MQAVLESPKNGILLKSGTNEVEFIEFYIDGNSYGVNVSKVQRVIALSNTRITSIAQAPAGVLGVIQVLEKPVLLIDLRKALGIQNATEPNERQLVMVTHFNKRTTAFLIDGISKIHRTSWSEFEPMTESLSGGGAGFTTGTIRINDRIVLILDLERIMLNFTDQSEEQKAAADKVPVRDRSSLKVVYAEDSKMIRRLTLDTLTSAGISQIKSFENGSDARAYILDCLGQAQKAGKPLTSFIDLVLTDIEMPKMDGLTLCKEVKSLQNAGAIPHVIVYSSLINEEMSRKCVSVGADAQLAKPNNNEIVGAIDKLLLK